MRVLLLFFKNTFERNGKVELKKIYSIFLIYFYGNFLKIFLIFFVMIFEKEDFSSHFFFNCSQIFLFKDHMINSEINSSQNSKIVLKKNYKTQVIWKRGQRWIISEEPKISKINIILVFFRCHLDQHSFSFWILRSYGRFSSSSNNSSLEPEIMPQT